VKILGLVGTRADELVRATALPRLEDLTIWAPGTAAAEALLANQGLGALRTVRFYGVAPSGAQVTDLRARGWKVS
jgi:hypothetical protein